MTRPVGVPRDCQEAEEILEAVRSAGLLTWDFSALGGTRTPNLLIRSQMLYPIELRAQVEPGESRRSEGLDTVSERAAVDLGVRRRHVELEPHRLLCRRAARHPTRPRADPRAARRDRARRRRRDDRRPESGARIVDLTRMVDGLPLDPERHRRTHVGHDVGHQLGDEQLGDVAEAVELPRRRASSGGTPGRAAGKSPCSAVGSRRCPCLFPSCASWASRSRRGERARAPGPKR